MANIGFTDEQKKAIETHGCDILVAAAAGSGKTAVLVERIIQMIIDEKNPIDIDRLLVVTFTDAAASEMKQRISKAIASKLEEDPFSEHLQKQISLLNKASITTIHSFCLKIIRQNFHLIDIDPVFRIADETEISLIKQEVVSDLFEEQYAEENNEQFLNLVECYGEKISDNSLQKLIITIHEFISSSPWPENWINESVEVFNLEECNSIDDTIWAKIIKTEIKNNLLGVLETITIAEKICNIPDGPKVYLENLYDDRILINQLLNFSDLSLEKTHDAFESIIFSRLKTIKKTDFVLEDLKEKVKKIRDKEIKSEVSKIKNSFFFKSPELIFGDIKNLYNTMKALGILVLNFSKKYIAIKKEKNIVDFNDLEHFCLQILLEKESTNENILPTSKALELREKYYEVLIDEYQDSNLVQELILSTVASQSPPNRFMVGDIKQSIYKFRRAKPELFMEKYYSFSDIKGKENLKIDLSKNFRSRNCIIDSVNFIFYQLMSLEVGEINYDEKQALYMGANFSENTESLNISNSTELHLIEQEIPEASDNFTNENTSQTNDNFLNQEIEELGKIELEANVISKRILELVYGEKKLYIDDKKGSYKETNFSDIVILVRSLSSIGETLIEELKKYNVPAFANTSGGYFNSLEVLTILALLQIIDNPIQDIHLLSVLHSPIYGLKSQDFLEIRNVNKKISLFGCIKEYTSEIYLIENDIDIDLKYTLEKFLSDLNKWRDLAVFTPINELIWQIYNDTNYLNYIGVMAGGQIRQANLNSLLEKAMQYETTSFKSLFHFIKYIERLQKSGNDSSNAKTLSENDNVVRIMTIHKSKGLEFPVVFVSMLGKNFNMLDQRKSLILHPELGFGPTFIDVENRVKTNTIARLALSKKLQQENLSEELRVLYVALTRAKEKLILTGSVTKLEEKLEKWSRFVELADTNLPSYFMLKAKTFLDFIVPTISRHKDGKNLIIDDIHYKNQDLYSHKSKFEIFFHSHSDIILEESFDIEKNKLLLQNLHSIDLTKNYSGFKNEIENNLSWKYKFELEKKLPTKVSISEIKRNYYELDLKDSQTNSEDIFTKVFDLPLFMQEEKELSATQKGTLMHSVVEHIDYHYHTCEEKIIELINQLVQKNIILESETKFISKRKILNLINSPLGERIRLSKKIKREIPFVMGVSAFEVYGEKQFENLDESILVHGIVDCYFEENNNIVLVDYKTDFVTEDNVMDILNKYKIQMNIYKKAIEKSTGKTVSQSIIYFFGIDKFEVLEI